MELQEMEKVLKKFGFNPMQEYLNWLLDNQELFYKYYSEMAKVNNSVGDDLEKKNKDAIEEYGLNLMLRKGELLDGLEKIQIDNLSRILEIIYMDNPNEKNTLDLLLKISKYKEELEKDGE